MIKKTLVAAGFASAFVLTGAAVFAQTSPPESSLNKARYLPEYTESGELKLPKNYNEWVFVGSPLTPNALNGGTANFPEFHNVYIEQIGRASCRERVCQYV